MTPTIQFNAIRRHEYPPLYVVCVRIGGEEWAVTVDVAEAAESEQMDMKMAPKVADA